MAVGEGETVGIEEVSVLNILIVGMKSLIITLSLLILYKSLTHVDWASSYTKARLINYVAACVGSGSVLIVVFGQCTSNVVALLHFLFIFVMFYLYKRSRWDSKIILWSIKHKAIHN